MPADVSVLTPGNGQGEKSMPDGTDKFHAVMEQNMAALGQSGVVAQNNFLTISKAADYDYMEGKRLVSLEEAMGVREVSSKEVPAGPANANK